MYIITKTKTKGTKTNTMPHTNTELRNIIQDHFAQFDARVSNITKATKDTLMGIINKHNIELTEPKKKEKKEDEKEELSVAEKVKVNELIKFNYESRCKGVGVYRQYQGVIEKITKKTMIIGGHTYKKEKMVIIAVAVDEEL